MSFIGRQDRMLLTGFAVALIDGALAKEQGRNCVCLSVEAALA